MMKFIMSSRIKNEIINAEETRRFLGNLVVSENSCCLCCSNDTGGLLCA